MHYVLQAIIISAVIGLLGRKLCRHVTVPPFAKKCAAVVFGPALQGLAFRPRRACAEPPSFNAVASLSLLSLLGATLSSRKGQS
jgi:hypothetical protein